MPAAGRQGQRSERRSRRWSGRSRAVSTCWHAGRPQVLPNTHMTRSRLAFLGRDARKSGWSRPPAGATVSHWFKLFRPGERRSKCCGFFFRSKSSESGSDGLVGREVYRPVPLQILNTEQRKNWIVYRNLSF
jgi:hypothetical protein